MMTMTNACENADKLGNQGLECKVVKPHTQKTNMTGSQETKHGTTVGP